LLNELTGSKSKIDRIDIHRNQFLAGRGHFFFLHEFDRNAVSFGTTVQM
jgi:hypothetical protein